MTNRIRSGIIDTESVKSAAREWGWAYALLFSLQSLAYTPLVLWFGITNPPAGGFYPAFTAILRDIGIAGLASIVLTTTVLEGWQTIMIISATFLKPRERRIREEGRAEGRAEAATALADSEDALAEARAEAAEARAEAAKAREAETENGMERGRAQSEHAEKILELERAAWQAWYQRSELARAKGEEPPPPPFFGQSNGRSR